MPMSSARAHSSDYRVNRVTGGETYFQRHTYDDFDAIRDSKKSGQMNSQTTIIELNMCSIVGNFSSHSLLPLRLLSLGFQHGCAFTIYSQLQKYVCVAWPRIRSLKQPEAKVLAARLGFFVQLTLDSAILL